MEKLTRILAGEDRRDLTTDVKLGLADPDRSVRRRAALAAGRIGDRGRCPPSSRSSRTPSWRSGR